MMSGCDPGELGIYGFRNRRDHSYDALGIGGLPRRARCRGSGTTSARRAGTSIADRRPAAPRRRPAVRGALVSCFLTPDPRRHPYTHPPELRDEIEGLVGALQVDVRNFRSEDRDRILAEIYAMTEQRFRVARHLLDTPAVGLLHDGRDRARPAAPRLLALPRPRPPAPRARPPLRRRDPELLPVPRRRDRRAARALRRRHRRAGRLRPRRARHGGRHLHQRVARPGGLPRAARRRRAGPTAFRDAQVDWARTRAWGEGGYYCRLCLNVEGREPQGVVAPEDVRGAAHGAGRAARGAPRPRRRPIGTRAHRPEDLWRERRGIPPDLVVYFGDLAWRSNGSSATAGTARSRTTPGPDDANHDRHGLWITAGPGVPAEHREDMSILDVAPTILRLSGLLQPV